MMEQGGGAGTAGAGGLAGYLVGFREELARCGYGTVRSGAHLELFADLCRWLEREGVALSELGVTGSGCSLPIGGVAGKRTWSHASAPVCFWAT